MKSLNIIIMLKINLFSYIFMMFYICCLTIKPILSSSFSMKYSYFLNKIISFPSASKRKATMKAPQKARKQNDDAPMLVGVYRSPSAHRCRSSSSSSFLLPLHHCARVQAKCNLWQRSAKYKWLGDATVTAKTATATMAGEVKQQSIKVSDYRRGTPECLPSMPLCWIAGLSDCWIARWPDDRQKGWARGAEPAPSPHPILPLLPPFRSHLPIHAAHDEDALCCKLKAGHPID